VFRCGLWAAAAADVDVAEALVSNQRNGSLHATEVKAESMCSDVDCGQLL
jgi:hypothetical protein